MSQIRLSRRAVLQTATAALALAGLPVIADDIAVEIENMQPGQYTWHPERAPSGPVAVVVSLPEQRVHVYRNGVRIAVSTCSTGKPGHETPTGVFTILEKDKDHHSSTYNDAAMPNMNRLTWDGVALHAGKLPGYPASHGCVRLPMAFSEKLFGVTHVGTPVIIAGSASDSWDLTHPGMVLGNLAEGEMATAVAGLKGKAAPSDWSNGAEYPVVTVLATGEDRRLSLMENGEEIPVGEMTLTGDGPLGELTAEMLDAHWAVNTRSALLLTQAFAAQHDGRAGGRVVFMTSGQGQGPMPGEVAYAAAKAALAGITLTLADQLADAGITINTVNPGPVDTGYMTPELTRAVAPMFPLGRGGEPDDPARLIAWLVSDEGRWMTGQVLHTEGGFARWRAPGAAE